MGERELFTCPYPRDQRLAGIRVKSNVCLNVVAVGVVVYGIGKMGETISSKHFHFQ